jgi:nitrogen fixation protein
MSIFKKKQTLFHKTEDCCDEQQINQINLRLDIAEGDIDQLEIDVANLMSGGSGVPYIGATQNVDLGEFELRAGQIELDQSPTGTAGVAVTRWNDTIGATETTLKGGNVVLKNGVDLVARVVNKVTPNTTLTKAAYQAVRISGAQGQRLAVALAQANNDNNSADTIGLVTETIATNQEGFILTVGQLEDINTTGSLQGETWVDGDVLYLSPTTAGQITNVKPTAPQHIVVIGYVEYAHANHGKIYVKVMNGWELGELHDVAYPTTLANGEILQYNASTLRWENTVPKIQVLAQASPNTTHTGTTNNTLVYSKLIDANKVATGDGLQIATKFTKPSGSAVNPTVRIYINTSASLSGATLLATYATTNLNGRFFLVERTANVDGATTNFIAASSGALTDSATLSTTAPSDVSIDWTVNQYIIVAIQLGNAADSTSLRLVNVILNKSV